MKKAIIMPLGLVAMSMLIASVCYGSTPIDIRTIDTLTLTIVNSSNQTLMFNHNMDVHSKSSFGFTLTNYRVRPGQITTFRAKALVSPTSLSGLGGTIFFHTNNYPNVMNFIIGDNAIGWRHMPLLGLSKNNPAGLTSTLSNVTTKTPIKAYDLAVESATVTIR